MYAMNGLVPGRYGQVAHRRSGSWLRPPLQAETTERSIERPAERYGHPMSLEWEQIVIDARDPVALGHWWLEALGWVIVNDDPDEFEIRPEADQLPGLMFQAVTEQKQSKNRLHLDFRPEDQDAEVNWLIAHGASRVDIGQGDVPWVVLADPEGNEFCVLGARRPSP